MELIYLLTMYYHPMIYLLTMYYHPISVRRFVVDVDIRCCTMGLYLLIPVYQSRSGLRLHVILYP